MAIHKNARLTPLGREHLIKMVVSGQTPQAVSEAVGVCPRTGRKRRARFEVKKASVAVPICAQGLFNVGRALVAHALALGFVDEVDGNRVQELRGADGSLWKGKGKDSRQKPRKIQTFAPSRPGEPLAVAAAGGQGGIRTRGGCYTTHAFQACALNRSATCPADPASHVVQSRSGRPLL